MALSIDAGRGRLALILAHCAGMVDLIGLPLWVGVLIEHYQFDPQQAGGLATLFLGGIVVSSLILAPKFNRLPKRLIATIGFAISAIGFFLAAQTTNATMLVALHGICGLATGAALSMTHGTVSQGQNPHRLMAMAGVALGIFAVIFMAFVPKLLIEVGGTALFYVFTLVMIIATLIVGTSFPEQKQQLSPTIDTHLKSLALPKAVWFGLIGFACICLSHAMTNSFVERVGVHHGFSREHIGMALFAMAVLSILPGILAAYLEHRLSIRWVLFLTPILHAVMITILMNSTTFPAYVFAMISLPGLMIFMNTFAFGAIAKLDPSGRALAAFPASIMIGSALGPLVGGTLVKMSGFSALSVAALMICVIVVLLFSGLTRSRSIPALAKE